MVREERREHFLSENFTMGDAGSVFPISWKVGEVAPQAVCARPEYVEQVAVFEKVLGLATPVFDKMTEDGMRFRVYKFGSLEVRSTQQHAGKEIVGAVFQDAKT